MFSHANTYIHVSFKNSAGIRKYHRIVSISILNFNCGKITVLNAVKVS